MMKAARGRIIVFWATAFLMLLQEDGVAATLSGIVLDEQGQPLSGVSVLIPALQRGAVTNDEGKFSFEKLPAGVYTVQFTLIGYGFEARQVRLDANTMPLSITLRISPVQSSVVTVTAGPQPTDVLMSPQAVSIVEGRQLDQNSGETVMQSIKKTPGVALYTTGTGVAKPVIRGLTSQRVLVVTDGIRQGGQQWGDEHGPEIDPLDVDRIEVVRGPSSVLYGSDALGGVVNIIGPEVPSASAGVPLLEGQAVLNGFSNNRQAAGALSLAGAKGLIGYRGNLSLRDAGDTRTPGGTLSNSGAREINGSGMIGTTGAWGSVGIDYAHFGQRLEIHEDPAEDPAATPFQSIQHDKVHLHSNFPFERLRLEAHGAWQRNDRREFEEQTAQSPVLNLRLHTITLDVKAHHLPVGPVFGTAGFSVERQRNASLAEEKLIPDFDLLNLGGFIYEEVRIGAVNVSGGVRMDTRNIDVKASQDLGVAAQTRDYRAVSGTTGVTWRIAEPFSIAANVGRGWRAPTAFELFVDGVHEGTVRFEVGDATLKPESSLNVESSLRYASARVQGEATVFRNRINRYIFSSPTGQIDPASGFQIYEIKQANATLIGAELALQAQVAPWLILNGGINLVQGTNEALKTPLPLMPANNGRVGARVTTASWLGLTNPYISVDAKIVAGQHRIEAFETPSSGYTLLDMGIGWEIPLNHSHRLTVDLAAKNLLDKAYTDHLSRYKAYALDPGRNILLKISVPFTLAE
jgi:iron complex outermembrane receptor protein